MVLRSLSVILTLGMLCQANAQNQNWSNPPTPQDHPDRLCVTAEMIARNTPQLEATVIADPAKLAAFVARAHRYQLFKTLGITRILVWPDPEDEGALRFVPFAGDCAATMPIAMTKVGFDRMMAGREEAL